MWNRLKKLLSGKPTESAASQAPEPPSPEPKFDEARPEVEALLQLDLTTETAESKMGDRALSVMKKMALDIDQIERVARGNPMNSIEGSLWLSGAGYGNLAQELTRRFRDVEWLDHEQFASALWARATLAVNARHHHLVGPAMLANADCQQRLGNPDRAKDIYTSVLKDFSFLIPSWQQKPDAPAGDEKTALECLQTALENLLAQDVADVDSTHLTTSREQVRQILGRAKADG